LGRSPLFAETSAAFAGQLTIHPAGNTHQMEVRDDFSSSQPSQRKAGGKCLSFL